MAASGKLGGRVVPSLLTLDVGGTVEFYRRLGFRLTGSFPPDGEPEWVEVTRDSVVLQFYTEPPAGTLEEPACSGTFYLHAEDLTALAEELRGKVPFEWGPEVMDYGMRELAVRDPNGYLLAFTEPA